MVDSAAKTLDSLESRPEYLERAVAALAKAGVLLAFPDHVDAAQTRWPEECPLSDEELRGELRSLLAEVGSLSQRAKALCGRLPEPHEFQLDDLDAVPESLYLMLYNALSYLIDEGLERSTKVIEDALVVTPEGIRADWLDRRLPNQKLKQLIPRQTAGS